MKISLKFSIIVPQAPQWWWIITYSEVLEVSKIKIKIRIYANIYMILMSEECRENGRHSANNAIEIYNYGMNV